MSSPTLSPTDGPPTLEKFTAATNIKVTYSTVIGDNDPFLASHVIPVLQNGHGADDGVRADADPFPDPARRAQLCSGRNPREHPHPDAGLQLAHADVIHVLQSST